MHLKTTSTSTQAPPTSYSVPSPLQIQTPQATVQATVAPVRRTQSPQQRRKLGIWGSFFAPFVLVAILPRQHVRPPAVQVVTAPPAPTVVHPPTTFCALSLDAEGTFVFQGDDELIAGVSQPVPGQASRKSSVRFDTRTGKERKITDPFTTLAYQRQLGADRAENLTQVQNLPMTPKAGVTLPFGTSQESIAFSTDGKYVATAYPEGIVVWDRASRAILKEIPRRNSYYGYSYIQFSPNGKLIGDAHADGIALWDWQKYTP